MAAERRSRRAAAHRADAVCNGAGGGWNVLPGVSMYGDAEYELVDSVLE